MKSTSKIINNKINFGIKPYEFNIFNYGELDILTTNKFNNCVKFINPKPLDNFDELMARIPNHSQR